MEQVVSSGNRGHHKPSFRFGIGGVPLGNEFAVVTGKDASATIDAAWNAGVRYCDAAVVVGASSEQQILADCASTQTKITVEFWAELKAQRLIEYADTGLSPCVELAHIPDFQHQKEQSYE